MNLTRTIAAAALIMTVGLVSTATVYAQPVPGGPNQPHKESTPKPEKEKKAKNIEICFFTEVDFKMTKHCVHRERRVSRMDDMWKDSIESITIDNASLKVCSEINLRGICHTYQSNKHELPADLFDHIYSYRIR